MIRLASTPAPHVPPASAISSGSRTDRPAQPTPAPSGERAEEAVPPDLASGSSGTSGMSLQGSPSPISGRDWDDLFKAVEDRLRQSIAARSAGLQGPDHPQDTALHAIVLDCLEALDMLHSALMRERSQRHQLELDILNAQSKTAQAMAMLVSRDVGYSSESAVVLRGSQAKRGVDVSMQSSLQSALHPSAQSL